MHIWATITIDHSQNLQSRVWVPSHCSFNPRRLLGAVLLVGALDAEEPSNCTSQSTSATQARAVALSLPKVLKSTLQSQAYHRQRLGPAGWRTTPQSLMGVIAALGNQGSGRSVWL